MSSRTIHGSLIVICMVGLAIAGIGWKSQGKSDRQVKENRVYCNIAELESRHPAWQRIADIKSLGSSGPVGSGGSVDPALVVVKVPDSSDIRTSVTRNDLKAELEVRADIEMDRLNEQMNQSVSHQIEDKTKELRARQEAADAEDSRRSELELAEKIRQLGQSESDRRVAASVKLALLKAQMKNSLVDQASIKSQIAENEKILNSLSGREETLRKDAQAQLSKTKADRQVETDRQISDFQALQAARVAQVMRSRRERLRSEINTKDFLPQLSNTSKMYVSSGRNASLSFPKDNGVARTASGTGLSGSDVRALTADQRSIKERIDLEIKSVVTRIARENGLVVVFRPEPGAKDRTDWFGSKLPYTASIAEVNLVGSSRK